MSNTELHNYHIDISAIYPTLAISIITSEVLSADDDIPPFRIHVELPTESRVSYIVYLFQAFPLQVLGLLGGAPGVEILTPADTLAVHAQDKARPITVEVWESRDLYLAKQSEKEAAPSAEMYSISCEQLLRRIRATADTTNWSAHVITGAELLLQRYFCTSSGAKDNTRVDSQVISTILAYDPEKLNYVEVVNTLKSILKLQNTSFGKQKLLCIKDAVESLLKVPSDETDGEDFPTDN